MIYDLIIVGGGVAGLCAAVEAKERGLDKVLIIEKNEELGGKLEDWYFPNDKYRKLLLDKFYDQEVEVKLGTSVLKIEGNQVACFGDRKKIEKLDAKNIVLATGGKVIEREALATNGHHLGGIHSIKCARRILNGTEKELGKRILIIGTNALESVVPLIRKKTKNIIGVVGENCEKAKALLLGQHFFDDYELEAIYGKDRVEQVVLRKDDEFLSIPCDTVLVALPLVCNNELIQKSHLSLIDKKQGLFQKSVSNIYACGQCVKADFTIDEVIRSAKTVVQTICESS